MHENYPTVATTLYSIIAKVPLLDLFCTEVEISSRTSRQASPLSYLSRWEYIHDDQLNPSTSFHPLEFTLNFGLAKEILTKIRRRKDLTDTINFSAFL
jgi:translation elongation factor EF-G